MTTQRSDWTVLKMIEWGTDWFSEKNVPSPRLSIEWLLADVLGVKRLNLYVQFDRPLTSRELDRVREYVRRRARHEPLQYITGSTTFYNCEIRVNPSVLIPRPETEELVDLVLGDYDSETLNVLDIGTGSGCIAISLAKARSSWNITAVDISEDALQTAMDNARENEVDIHFVKGDLFRLSELNIAHKWDVIVSNPPYVGLQERASLEEQVRAFEPSVALFCEDRAAVYDALSVYARNSLVPGGRLYAELHCDHTILDEAGYLPALWSPAEIIPDSSGRNRILRARTPQG
jgi:release factor glutamine methyltransferase